MSRTVFMYCTRAPTLDGLVSFIRNVFLSPLLLSLSPPPAELHRLLTIQYSVVCSSLALYRADWSGCVWRAATGKSPTLTQIVLRCGGYKSGAGGEKFGVARGFVLWFVLSLSGS